MHLIQCNVTSFCLFDLYGLNYVAGFLNTDDADLTDIHGF